jgi:ATP-dependent protease ClpP protease subunit
MVTPLSKKTRNQKSYIIEEVHKFGLCLDTREIFLHGYFDNGEEDPGVNYQMANTFLKNIRILESCGEDIIIIHQHNLGGYVHDGMMIYDAIANSTCHVLLIMHGIAASMGAVIPQAADTRVIMPNTMFMVHDGSSGGDVLTYKQVQSVSAYEREWYNITMGIYGGVCVHGDFFKTGGYDEDGVIKFIKKKLDQKEDWWLLSNDVVKYGFADAVWGDQNYENIEKIKVGINERG